MAWAGTLVDFKNGVSWTGAANNDLTPNFQLLGGKYALGTYSSGTASATLQVVISDGSSNHSIACGSATTTYATFDLPAGTFNIVMGATAGTAAGFLVPVPYRPSA